MKRFSWHYIRAVNAIEHILVKTWSRIYRKQTAKYTLSRPIKKGEKVVFAANHQTYMDPFVIFNAFPTRKAVKLMPVKFMTWHKYYNSKAKPFFYSSGCFPSHGDKFAGVEGAVYFLKRGYNSFIFPEGKRVKDGKRIPAFKGIVRILEEVPDARLILVKVDWEKRKSKFSRPKLYIHAFDAPKNLDKTDPDKIMDAIYKG